MKGKQSFQDQIKSVRMVATILGALIIIDIVINIWVLLK